MDNAIDRRLIRHQSAITKILELIEDTEIDAALNNLSTELRRCWSILRDVNKAGSKAQTYHTLDHLLTKKGPLDLTVWEIDPATRALIEDHHPDGPRALESSPIDSKRLQQDISGFMVSTANMTGMLSTIAERTATVILAFVAPHPVYINSEAMLR
jgi:hypothetical protein